MITNNSAFEMLYLLQQQTTNTTTQAYKINFTSPSVSLIIWGTWNGAKVTIQVSTVPNIDNVTSWVTVRDWANSFEQFYRDQTVTLKEYVKGQYIRAIVSGAAPGTSINCTLQVIY